MRIAAWMFMLCALGCTRVNTPAKGGNEEAAAKGGDPWPTAAAELARAPETATARKVLVELNRALEADEQSLPVMSAETAGKLAAIIPATADERSEWEAKSFTAMDANYLGECLLLHQLARGLEIDSLPEAERARAAFDWLNRVVYDRLWAPLRRMPNGAIVPQPMPPMPPAEVLRRGYGTGLERAYIFLALARQLRLEAFLLGTPDALAKPGYDRTNPALRGAFWAIGIRSGNDLLIFDPWLGEPMPSPDGKGIAKLSQVKADFAFARAWYDKKQAANAPTSETMYNSIAIAAAPMNAFTPRMRALEEKIRRETGGVTLSVDAMLLADKWQPIAGGSVKWHCPAVNDPASYFAPARQLAYFTSREDGGLGSRTAEESLAFISTRFAGVQAEYFPPPAELKFDVARLEFGEYCAAQFRAMLAEPGFQEKILRGQYTETLTQLVELERTFAAIRDQYRSATDVQNLVKAWYEANNEAYRKLGLAARNPELQDEAMKKVGELWGKNSAGYTAVRNAVAEFGSHEIDYLLALCKHEMAERTERKFAKQKTAETAAKRKADWAAARQAWSRYRQNAAKFDGAFPGRSAHAAKLAARADAMNAP